MRSGPVRNDTVIVDILGYTMLTCVGMYVIRCLPLTGYFQIFQLLHLIQLNPASKAQRSEGACHRNPGGTGVVHCDCFGWISLL